jgi:hypothetical protein
MRLLVVLVLSALVLPWGSPPYFPAWAADQSSATAEEEATSDQGDSSATEDEQVEEEKPEDGEEETGESAEEGEEQDLPEGVRRRPSTGEQERWYKQRKTREDPFLNPPVSTGLSTEDGYYNPADWLRPDVQCGLSRYMVQDESGAVIGYSIFAIERESDPVLGNFIKLQLIDESDTSAKSELWLYAETLKPRFKEIVTQLPDSEATAEPAGEDQSGDSQAVQEIKPLYQNARRLKVNYLFDRMTIIHHVGGITARRQMRQLPFSYDIDELLLLMRQIEVNHEEWPFEAILSDPANETHLPISIAQPVRVENVMDADMQRVDCYQFTVRSGAETQTYLVQRIPPYKLVKYTIGSLTYTLSDYLEQQ